MAVAIVFSVYEKVLDCPTASGSAGVWGLFSRLAVSLSPAIRGRARCKATPGTSGVIFGLLVGTSLRAGPYLGYFPNEAFFKRALFGCGTTL